MFISSTPRQDKRSISVALLWINYVWWNVIQLLVHTQFHAIIRTFCRCNKWVLHHAAEQHMLFLQWCLQEHLQVGGAQGTHLTHILTSTGDSLDTHLCLELPLLYIRKVTRGWIFLSRERYLWSPWEISIWLLREGRGTRWGLCAASSECLQRGLLGPQEVSLTETALPCLAQGAVSAGKWHECSVEVDHQCVTEARCGPENLFNIKKTQRNSSSQGQAHI